MEQLYQPYFLAFVFWLSLACWLGVGSWEGRQHRPIHTFKEGRKSDLVCFYSVGISLVAVITIKLVWPTMEIYTAGSCFWSGIGLIWLGMLVRHCAIQALDKYHVMTIAVEAKQPVVANGLYARIRHPSYLGAIIAIVGVATCIDSLVGSPFISGRGSRSIATKDSARRSISNQTSGSAVSRLHKTDQATVSLLTLAVGTRSYSEKLSPECLFA